MKRKGFARIQSVFVYNRVAARFAIFFIIGLAASSNTRAFAGAPGAVWEIEIAAQNSSNINLGPYTAVDQNGNSYLAGTFNVPVLTVGTKALTNSGANHVSDIGFDTFFAKYDTTGNFLWLRQIGGDGDDYVRATVADPSGNLLITVTSSSTNVFSGTNVFSTNLMAGAGGETIVVAKFDPQGSLAWSRNILCNAYASGRSLATDAGGNVFLAGTYDGSNLLFGTTTLTNSNPSSTPDFLAKYDPAGNLLWVQPVNLSGAGHPVVATDAGGDTYLFEVFTGVADFGGVQVTNLSQETVALAKFDPNGNVLLAREAARSGSTSGAGISAMRAAVDTNGNCFLTGGYSFAGAVLQGTTLPLTGLYNNAFVAKYDSSGNLVWANPIAGSVEEDPGGVTVDAAGNCYATGVTGSPTLTIGGTTLTNASSPALAAGYAAKYDAAGNALWAQLLSFPGDDAVDLHGNLYSSGTILTSIDGIPYFSCFAVKISGPVVTISPTARGVVVTWPTNAAGMGLQSSANAVGGNWSFVTNSSANYNGQFTVTLSVTNSPVFFRLHNL
jgi:hypothetical protein